MPAGQGQDAARFAAALETTGVGLQVDPALLDPALRRDLEVVGMLRSVGATMAGTAAPGAATSARIKARLFATIGAGGPEPAADRPAADGRLAPVVDIGSLGRGRHRIASAVRHRPAARRAFVVSAAAAVLLVVLSSTGVLLSENALPGEALYAMKRSAESVGLGLTFDAAEKARKNLEFAATRLDEVGQLVAEAGSAGVDPALVADTLGDLDAAARSASQLMLADPAGNAASLATLRDWANGQAARLTTLLPKLPTVAQADADDSMTLLSRVQGRTDALKARLACHEVASSITDDLGPLPAGGRCVPAASGPATAQSRNPGGPGAAPSAESGTAAPPGGGAGLPQLLPNDPVAPLTDQVPGAGSNGPPAQAPLGLPPISLPPLLPGLPGVTVG